MPGMNQTGPNGAGPKTGSGRGVCCGGAAESGFSGGRGGQSPHHPRKRGCGCRGFAPALGSADRRETLQAQAEHLKNRLDFIQKELDNGVAVNETDDVSES